MGGICGIRLHAKAIFSDIEDESGKLQIFLRQEKVDGNADEWRELNFKRHSDPANAGEESPGARHYPRDSSAPLALQNDAAIISPFQFFKEFFDMGDFIEVHGILFKTKQNANALQVRNFRMLAKALVSIPTDHFGIKDEEERLRKRYLDILANPEVKEMFYKKAKFWQSVREFLMEKGFLEVETPVLENTTGGADAKPFITRHNALDMDVYLRISMGGLWQKRLMVAGYEKTFEIGRQFRDG